MLLFKYMNQQPIPQKTTTKTFTTASNDVFKTILEEIRLLRSEVSLLFPNEDLNDYANSERIEKSHQNAIKSYPPLSL